jgi:hypothetical protein
VENELWVALLLTSSVIKPLTAPELAAIFSALALNEQQKKKFVPNKVGVQYPARKFLLSGISTINFLTCECCNMEVSFLQFLQDDFCYVNLRVFFSPQFSRPVHNFSQHLH